MLPGNLLFVVTLRADLTISGLAYRLMAAWRHLYEHEEKGKVFLITTLSLWEKMYGDEKVPEKWVKVINDRDNYSRKALLLPLTVITSIIRNRIKIVHTNGNYLVLPVHYLKKLLGVKTVVTFGSANIEMATGYSKYARRQWELVLNAATAIDVLNPVNTINSYRSRKFVSACSFPFSSEMMTTYAEAEVDKTESITFIGSLTPQKNPMLAVLGFGEYIERYHSSEAQLEIFGKGKQKAELLRLADEVNKKAGRQAVNIHEKDHNRYELLRKSKIFLSLQDYTNYPSQSLMEAMMLGNSIIATDFGDTNFMVLPENGNVLIAEKNPELVAEAIHQILNQKQDFNRQNADFIAQNHSIERFTAYLKNMYRSISSTN